MKDTRPLVVNILGGPGVGKSATAHGLVYKLMLKHIDTEYVQEYAKDLNHAENFKTLKNQSYVTPKQLNRQYVLSDKYEVIVTDTSVLLGLIYKGFGCTPSFESWILECYNLFDNLNILLERNPETRYQAVGRSQAKDEAMKLDSEVKILLDRLNLPYVTIPVDGERTVDLAENEVYTRLIKRGYKF